MARAETFYRIAVRPDGTWALFEVYRSARGWVRHYVGEVA